MVSVGKTPNLGAGSDSSLQERCLYLSDVLSRAILHSAGTTAENPNIFVWVQPKIQMF